MTTFLLVWSLRRRRNSGSIINQFHTLWKSPNIYSVFHRKSLDTVIFKVSLDCFCSKDSHFFSFSTHMWILIKCDLLLSSILWNPNFLFSNIKNIYTFSWVIWKQQRWYNWKFLLSCGYSLPLSHGQLFVTLWTIANQASLSMGFPRQECWSGLPCPSPGDPPDPGIEPTPPASLLHCRWILYHWAMRTICRVSTLYISVNKTTHGLN